MDLAGRNVEVRRARGRCPTVAVASCTFRQPVRVGDEVSVYARILREGRSSLHLHVEAWRRSREADDRQKVTQATFIFVALEEKGRPRPLPKDECEGKG